MISLLVEVLREMENVALTEVHAELTSLAKVTLHHNLILFLSHVCVLYPSTDYPALSHLALKSINSLRLHEGGTHLSAIIISEWEIPPRFTEPIIRIFQDRIPAFSKT